MTWHFQAGRSAMNLCPKKIRTTYAATIGTQTHSHSWIQACMASHGYLRAERQGSLFATKAVETQVKGSVFATKAVETQVKGRVLPWVVPAREGPALVLAVERLKPRQLLQTALPNYYCLLFKNRLAAGN